MAEPSIVAGGEEPEERVIEAALRPKNLHDFVGQQSGRELETLGGPADARVRTQMRR